MHIASLICTTLAFLPAALADRSPTPQCDNNKPGVPASEYDVDAQKCFWYSGESTFCGTSDYYMDEEAGGYKLVAWTKERNIDDLYRVDEEVSAACYGKYGLRCATGYKDLWCEVLSL